MEQDTLKKLDHFLKQDKFSAPAWEKRGLNPSSAELCLYMNNQLNECCKELMELVKKDTSTRTLKDALKKGLKSFRPIDYDTEEREFIGDYFYELGQNVQVDMGDELDKWMYGRILYSMMKVNRLLKGPEKIIKTVSQDCTKCQAKLETFILKMEEGIPSHTYDIVSCNACGEYNLIDREANVKELKFGNYKFEESLSKEEYTKEEALTRLEQIKYWRKK